MAKVDKEGIVEKIDISYEIRVVRDLTASIEGLMAMAASCDPTDSREHAIKADLDRAVSGYIDMTIDGLKKIKDNL